jgi:hypothetical protein
VTSSAASASDGPNVAIASGVTTCASAELAVPYARPPRIATLIATV